MPQLENVLLLIGEALLYFLALSALLRARTRIGLGAFFCALGVMAAPYASRFPSAR